MADALARNRYRPRKPAQMKWSNWYLTTLKLAVGLLLALLIVLFWLLRQNAANEQRTTLIADVLWLEQSVNFRLEGNAEQFQQLALDLVLAPETNQSALFRLRSQHLLKNNPELQQVLWLDASAQILAALPTQNLPRLGLGEPGNEVQAQTIERASKLGKPVYTEVYRISNSPQFEVFFPVFQNNQYQGSLVGVYSLNTLLKHLVPWWFTEKYQVRILDADGTTLASKSKVSDAATTLSYTLAFDPPGYGLAFQVTAYRSDSNIAQTLITTLIIALAAAVLVSLWVMRGHIQRRLAAEQALRSEYAFRKAMEDSLTVGMRARDLEGVVTYTNPAFCQMVGFSAEELIDAKPPMPYWAPEDMERIQSIHNSIIDGKAPHEGFEVRLMRKDGSRFDALIYEAPLIDADGRQTGWMASIIDVTVRKHAEELARQQQEKLQFTSRLITMGEMASALAHELNQPLAAITSYNTGCLNKLESGNFSPDELKHALGKIAVQAQRAGQIIRRVHDFVRKSEPKLAPCDLAEVIDDSVGFIDAAAKLLNIRIEREIQGMRPELMADLQNLLTHSVDPRLTIRVRAGMEASFAIADATQIEQVLLNLMRNGIEAMSETPLENRRLTVKLYQKDDHMQIRVIDRGSGIPLELREKLFTPFYSTKTEGMGIGLNICRSIIEFHRGRLWVEDNPEGGTIFVISLPITMP